MIRPPPKSTRVRSSAASDVYKRQVQDDRNRTPLVPDDVHESGNPGVEEGGVPYHGDRFVSDPPCVVSDFGHAVGHPHARSHAYTGVHGFQGRKRAQRVATYVSTDVDSQPAERGEDAPVRTTWTC